MAAARRPFGLKIIAFGRASIEITLDRKGLDPFPASLTDRAERRKHPPRNCAQFLGEFAPRRGFGVFARTHEALWDRPRAQIPVAPKRPARMNQQDAKIFGPAPVHQNAGASDGHKSEAERIGIGQAMRPCAGQRRHRVRLLEPDISVKLIRENRLEIMAQKFGVGPIDDADRPFKPRR